MRSTLRNKTIFKSVALRKGTPSSSTLFPTNAQAWVFLLKTQQHCLQGREGKNRYRFRKIDPKYARVLSKIVSKDSSCRSEIIRVSLKSVDHFVLLIRVATACHGYCSEVYSDILPLMSRFARSSKNCQTCDFSQHTKNRKSDNFSHSLRFFAVFCDVNIQSELSIWQNLQKLRKFVSLTIFSVTCDFSQFFVILIIT